MRLVVDDRNRQALARPCARGCRDGGQANPTVFMPDEGVVEAVIYERNDLVTRKHVPRPRRDPSGRLDDARTGLRRGKDRSVLQRRDHDRRRPGMRVSVDRVETIVVRLPERADFRWLSLSRPLGEFVLARISGDGVEGWGEVVGLRDWGDADGRRHGETPATICSIVHEYLAPCLFERPFLVRGALRTARSGRRRQPVRQGARRHRRPRSRRPRARGARLRPARRSHARGGAGCSYARPHAGRRSARRRSRRRRRRSPGPAGEGWPGRRPRRPGDRRPPAGARRRRRCCGWTPTAATSAGRALCTLLRPWRRRVPTSSSSRSSASPISRLLIHNRPCR